MNQRQFKKAAKKWAKKVSKISSCKLTTRETAAINRELELHPLGLFALAYNIKHGL